MENGTFRKLVQHQTFAASWVCNTHILCVAFHQVGNIFVQYYLGVVIRQSKALD
jgi:hypothetical protein